MKLSEALGDISTQAREIHQNIVTTRQLVFRAKELSKSEETQIQNILDHITALNKKTNKLLETTRAKRHKKITEKKPKK